MAGAKVVLVSDQHCPVVGERTTDEKGHFVFLDVAPGPEYHLYFLPPKGWKIKYENPMGISVYGPPENHYPWRIDAEEGDAPLPTVPVNPADCSAAGTPTSTTGARAVRRWRERRQRAGQHRRRRPRPRRARAGRPGARRRPGDRRPPAPSRGLTTTKAPPVHSGPGRSSFSERCSGDTGKSK